MTGKQGQRNPFGSVEQLPDKSSGLRAMANAMGAISYLSKITAESKMEKVATASI